MNKALGLMMVLAMAAVPLAPSAAQAGFSFTWNVSFGDDFYYGDWESWDTWGGSFSFEVALDGYGYWTYVPTYGRVWVPYVSVGWQPYYYGYWVWSSYGWTWVPYEPWGWIPHHYGRWVFDSYYGWYWVPGYTWGPAWVTWRWTATFVGWAPLPPEHYYYYSHRSYSRHAWRGDRRDPSRIAYPREVEYMSGWVFVTPKQFTATNIAQVAFDRRSAERVLRTVATRAKAEAPSRDLIERFAPGRIVTARMNKATIEMGSRKIELVRPEGQLDRIKRTAPAVRRKFMKTISPETGERGSTDRSRRPPVASPGKIVDDLGRNRNNGGAVGINPPSSRSRGDADRVTPWSPNRGTTDRDSSRYSVDQPKRSRERKPPRYRITPPRSRSNERPHYTLPGSGSSKKHVAPPTRETSPHEVKPGKGPAVGQQPKVRTPNKGVKSKGRTRGSSKAKTGVKKSSGKSKRSGAVGTTDKDQKKVKGTPKVQWF
jgi:hypothetical protein